MIMSLYSPALCVMNTGRKEGREGEADFNKRRILHPHKREGLIFLSPFQAEAKTGGNVLSMGRRE